MAELLLIFDKRFRYFTAQIKRYAAIRGGTLRKAAYLFFSAVKNLQNGENPISTNSPKPLHSLLPDISF